MSDTKTKKRRPWVKVWNTWWTSPSHQVFGPNEHTVGLWCMNQANMHGRADDPDARGFVLNALEEPIPVSEIARAAKITVAEAERSLSIIVRVGTMAAPCNGPNSDAYSFPNMENFQGNKSTRRSRKRRDKEKATRDATRNATREATPLSVPARVASDADATRKRIRGSEDQKIRRSEGGEGRAPPPVAQLAPPPDGPPPLDFDDGPARAELEALARGIMPARLFSPPSPPFFLKFSQSLLESFIAADPAREDIEWWRKVFLRAVATNFLAVPEAQGGKRGGPLTLGWFLKPGNIERLLNGDWDEYTGDAPAKKAAAKRARSEEDVPRKLETKSAAPPPPNFSELVQQEIEANRAQQGALRRVK